MSWYLLIIHSVTLNVSTVCQCFVFLKELAVKKRTQVELKVRNTHGGIQQKLPVALQSSQL